MKGYSGIEATYDDKVAQLIKIAREEAVKSKHSQVGTGHLLIALRRVAPESLVVKNLPRGIVGKIRQQMGMGDGTVKAPLFSPAFESALKGGEVVYGGGVSWDIDYSDPTSRIEIGKLVEKLIGDVRRLAWQRSRGEALPKPESIDCAEEVLASTVEDLILLDSFAKWEHKNNIEDAVYGLNCERHLKFLTQVFATKRYSASGEIAGELRRIRDTAQNSVGIAKQWLAQHQRTADISTKKIAEFEAQTASTQQQLEQLDAVLEQLPGETNKPDWLVKQKEDLVSQLNQLQEKIAGTKEWQARDQEEEDGHKECLAEREKFYTTVGSLLKTYDETTSVALQKAHVEGTRRLFSDLKKLTK